MCERNPGEITAVGDPAAAAAKTLVLNAQSGIVLDFGHGNILLPCRDKTRQEV